MRRRSTRHGVLAAAIGFLVACTSGGDGTRDAAVPGRVDLTGGGATFPYPVYTRWFSRWYDSSRVRINYQAIGSGAGVRQLIAGTLDFAATDVPLDTSERRRLAARDVRMIPMVVGGVAVTYHLPDTRGTLRLDGPTLADILLGRITRWNDARLVALNPDLVLPANDLLVVYRADASGTTYIISDYLARVSPAWAAGPGRGKDIAWPVGLGQRGNEGVAGQVKTTPYTLGLVEAVFALQNRLPAARLRNHAGAWVTPQTGNLRAAAAAMLPSIDDTVEFATSINDAPGEQSYPIAALSWLVVPGRGGRDTTAATGVRRFVRWALQNGDTDALALGYAPLPAEMRARLLATLDSTPAPP
ncbi:MAG: phosphate ABC transporter substrate-binding protein PstS [Gemmatimonadaceae bacterium]|nr:phosphate ABC transporter substrate-binding protein PstS [Gemmatimonadaceae bacterium]